ncbi:DNA alkylation repair protein [Candidatus Woesearchaeota archaeon]|nr:DNA alkylation repair protein [Candidatus Woesearchaeota archaeon]
MLANPQKAKLYQRFFKTGKGEYAEGDIFLGITVPEQRKRASKYSNLNLTEIEELLHNPIHEYRLTALITLINRAKSKKISPLEREELFNFYLKNTKYINNWDLVDISAPHLAGNYLLQNDNKERQILYKLARSTNLWEKRISIITTLVFIRHKQFNDTMKIAEILLTDEHDLIHKAVGWTLREIGKKDQKIEEEFLLKHYKTMPRTMLRYAIEKFEEEKRQFYLRK